MNQLVATGFIERRIYRIRGKSVMLDRDLAELYGVPTKVLNRAVKRHRKRFPEDFMLQLTSAESRNWKCQFGITNRSVKMGLRKRPYAFTQLGVAMLSSVLNSERAIQINIAIMRVFDRLREIITANHSLAPQVAEHERRLDEHDQDISSIMEAVPSLPEPTPEPRRIIDFQPPDPNESA